MNIHKQRADRLEQLAGQRDDAIAYADAYMRIADLARDQNSDDPVKRSAYVSIAIALEREANLKRLEADVLDDRIAVVSAANRAALNAQEGR